MSESDNNQYTKDCKKVWWIYTLIVIAVILFLVFVVAQDNEEKLFYTIMPAVGSYVLRPTKKMINKAVMKLFGTAAPVEPTPETND